MVALLVGAALLAQAQDTLTLTLEEAVHRAAQVSPLVLAAEGAVAAPTGERSVVRSPFQGNPVFQYAGAQRTSETLNAWDWEWSLRQEVEIGGQWSVRSSAAEHRIRAATERVSDAVRITGLDTRLRFLDLRMAIRTAALADSAAVFAEQLAVMAGEQLDAGAISALEYNATVVEAARTRSQADRASATRDAAAARLAVALGIEPPATVEALPLPPLPSVTVIDGAGLAMVARSVRPDLRADSLAVEAASRDITAAKRRIIPNLELAGFTGREAGTDDLLGFSVGLKVPLVDQGQWAAGLAEASRAAAEARRMETQRAIDAEILGAGSQLERSLRAERQFAAEGLAAARDNAALIRTAFEEGAVGVAEVIFLRAATVAAEVEYIEALRSAYSAWFELSAALGVVPESIEQLINGAGQ